MATGYPKERNRPGYHHGAIVQQAPAESAQPRPSAAFESDAQRIATALEAQNAYNQSARAKKDAQDALNAQKDTAKWAGWMFFIATIETGITGLGVLLVGLTLNEARKSATEAHNAAIEMKKAADAAEKSANIAITGLRPWMKIEASVNGPLVFDDDGISVDIEVRVTNVGKSPATRVKVSSGLGAANRLFKNRLMPGIDAAKTAVSRAEISNSERIVYDHGRSAEELARLKTIGDVFFPDEQREVSVIDWKLSKGELSGVIFDGDGTPFVAVFYAISAEYRFGSDWGVTTVVYALEHPVPQSQGDDDRPNDDYRFWDSSIREHSGDMVLRKLPVYTTAT